MTPQEAIDRAASEKGAEILELLTDLHKWSDVHVIRKSKVWQRVLEMESTLRNRSSELEKQPTLTTTRSTVEYVSEDVLKAAFHFCLYVLDGCPTVDVEETIQNIVSVLEEDDPEAGYYAPYEELLKLLFDLAAQGIDEVTLEVR